MLKRFKSVLSAIGLALSAVSAAGAEDGVEVRVDEKSPALHMILGKQTVFAVPAFEDYMYMFFDLCDAMELKVGYEGAMTIIAHELGHHYCHHLGKAGDPSQELEADRFAGAAMKKAGFKLDDTLAAVHILDERPSKSHPARADRIASITEGWNEPNLGKQCR